MAVRRSRACLRVLWVVLVIAVLWPAPSMAIDLAETIRTCQGLSLAAKGWGSVEAPEPWGEGRPAHQPIQVPAATRAHVVADCQGAIAELFVEELRPDPSAVSITRTSTPGPEGGKLFTWHRYEWQYRASLALGGGKTADLGCVLHLEADMATFVARASNPLPARTLARACARALNWPPGTAGTGKMTEREHKGGVLWTQTMHPYPRVLAEVDGAVSCSNRWPDCVVSWSDGEYWVIAVCLRPAYHVVSVITVSEQPPLIERAAEHPLTTRVMRYSSPRKPATRYTGLVDAKQARKHVATAAQIKQPEGVTFAPRVPEGQSLPTVDSPPQGLTRLLPGLAGPCVAWKVGDTLVGIVQRTDDSNEGSDLPMVLWTMRADRIASLTWLSDLRAPDPSERAQLTPYRVYLLGAQALREMLGWPGDALLRLPLDSEPLPDYWLRLSPKGDTLVGIEAPERLDQSQWGRCTIYAHPVMLHMMFR